MPLLLVIAMATALRFWALGTIPPGLYHDEAFNGLDALGVLEGERPVFFEANNGREPLFIYLVALSVAALGRSPGAIRIVAGPAAEVITFGKPAMVGSQSCRGSTIQILLM